MEREEIYKQVVEKVNVFCKENFENFDVQVEGSCEETYRYMSRKNVNLALQMCFDETYKLCKSE